MLRWIAKGLLYCLAGIAIFELARELMNLKSHRRWESKSAGRRQTDLDRALREDPGRMVNMTGPGRGMTTLTEDADGAASPHLVGRGVVSP